MKDKPGIENSRTGNIAERNRRNAQHSTGPKTEGGKARSAMNATKHGLSAKSLVLPGEPEEQAMELVELCRQDLSLSGKIGEELAANFALSIQKESRLQSFEDCAVVKSVEEAEDLGQYPETEVIDRLQKLLGAAQIVLTALTDPDWREANKTVHGAQATVNILRSMVDASGEEQESDAASGVAGLELLLESLSKSGSEQVANIEEKVEGVVLGAVQVVQTYIARLHSRIAELESKRDQKVDRAVQLAQIPDDKTVRLIDRYRKSNEQSMLRKLEIVQRLKDLMADPT